MYCRPGFLTHGDLAPVYASADVHVSCSHFETLGNTGERTLGGKTIAGRWEYVCTPADFFCNPRAIQRVHSQLSSSSECNAYTARGQKNNNLEAEAC